MDQNNPLPQLVASLRGLLRFDWRNVYEVLAALRVMGSAGGEAAPALLRLQAEIEHEIHEGNEWRRPVADAIGQTLAAIFPLTLRMDDVDAVTFRSKILNPPNEPRRGELLQDPACDELIDAAAGMGIPVDERVYAVFMRYASNPSEEGYLAQLQIVTGPALREALGEAAMDWFPEQSVPVAELLTGFMRHQREEWPPLPRADPRSYITEELSFGIRTELPDGSIFRVWSFF